jgi:hypothetical protein
MELSREVDRNDPGDLFEILERLGEVLNHIFSLPSLLPSSGVPLSFFRPVYLSVSLPPPTPRKFSIIL